MFNMLKQAHIEVDNVERDIENMSIYGYSDAAGQSGLNFHSHEADGSSGACISEFGWHSEALELSKFNLTNFG